MVRKNKAEEASTTEEVEVRKPTKGAYVYTYVGGGEGSPHMINFMGMQRFTRGVATEVTNPKVLAKIAINPCFVEGEVDMDELHKYDEEAKVIADSQRAKDIAVNNAFKKQQRALAKGLPAE